MRSTLVALFLAALLARPCLAIEEAVSVDTAHPRATLTPLAGIQGMSKDLRVYVYQSGQAYTNLLNSVVTLYYGTNLIAMNVGTATNVDVRTWESSVLIRTVPLPPGRFMYALSITEGGRTNDLGTGILTVAPSSFAGGWYPIPGQTIDWSTLRWAGSNQPARATDAVTGTVVRIESDPIAMAAFTNEASARAVLGTALSNSVSVALTNWTAALGGYLRLDGMSVMGATLDMGGHTLGSVSSITAHGGMLTLGTGYDHTGFADCWSFVDILLVDIYDNSGYGTISPTRRTLRRPDETNVLDWSGTVPAFPFGATGITAAQVGAMPTNGNASTLTNFPALLLTTNGSASGLSGRPSGAVATNDTRYLGSVTNAVGSTSTNVSIWTGTAASYAALTATNANCIYFVK